MSAPRRSGRTVRPVQRYEPVPDGALEDDSTCDEFSDSDDDVSVMSGSHLGDVSNDESFDEEDDGSSDESDSDSDDEECPDEEEDCDDFHESDLDEEVVDWDRLTENASESESSDDEEL